MSAPTCAEGHNNGEQNNPDRPSAGNPMLLLTVNVNPATRKVSQFRLEVAEECEGYAAEDSVHQ